jgi:hypothetical protein
LKEDSMRRSLVFVLIAVVSAAFLVTGCSQATESDSGIVIGSRLVDTVVTTEVGLLAALYNPAYQVIAVTGNEADASFYDNGGAAFSTVEEIPADKTVVLYRQVVPALTGLEVKGLLVVEGNGELVATATNRIRVTEGAIEVINGTITVDSVVDIHGEGIQIQILGTGKAYIAGGTLNITNPLASLQDVKTAFSWVPKGQVVIDTVTGAVKPSELTQIPATNTRRLTITDPLIDGEDDATSLTVPEGMTFETADPLAFLTDLDVKGTLTASAATFEKVENLTVTGDLTAGSANYASVKALEVTTAFGGASANFPALESLTVKKGGEFTASTIGSAAGISIAVEKGGEAEVATITKLLDGAIAGELIVSASVALFEADAAIIAAAGGTVNGIVFPGETPITALATNVINIGDSTIPAGKTLTIGTGTKIILADTKILTIELDSQIVGPGSLVVGATTISSVAAGGWQATGGNITITSSDAGAAIGIPTGGTPAALTALGTPAATATATIIQAADTGNNLTVGANVTIALGGTGTTAIVGQITLNNSAATDLNDNGKLTLLGEITTGNAVVSEHTAVKLADDYITLVASATEYTAIGIAKLKGDGAVAKVVCSKKPTDATTATANALIKLEGGPSATITGGDITATTANVGTISAATETVADTTA